jgi:hypothetical protein
MKLKGAPPAKAPKARKLAAPPVRKMGPKPHIRMQKLKPVPPGAFPTGPAAFPTTEAAPGPDAAMSDIPGGMPTGAAPGTMGD